MRIDDAFPSNYLKAKDLENKEVQVVIESVTMEDIGDGDKPVLRFVKSKKGLVCNKTNALTISDSLGEETDDWVGKDLILYPAKTMYEGKMVPCIRVKVPVLAQDGPTGNVVADADTEPPF